MKVTQREPFYLLGFLWLCVLLRGRNTLHDRWCFIRQSKIARCFARCFFLSWNLLLSCFVSHCHVTGSKLLERKDIFCYLIAKHLYKFLHMCSGHMMLLFINKNNKPERTVMALQGKLSTNIIILFPLSNHNPATIWTHLSLQHPFYFHVECLFLFHK